MFRRILTFCALLLFAQSQLGAQSYRPKDTWPFLYREFTEGIVCNQAGDQILDARLNISVTDQRLYFIRDEKMMVADLSRVFSAKIGEDVYVNAGGKFYKVLVENEGGAVAVLTQVDSDRMNKASIGYGVMSATASTQNVAALTLDSNVGTNLNQALQSRDSGVEIPVLERLFIIYSYGRVVPALKREVMDIPGLNVDAAKEFFKKNKIKWSNPASLSAVAAFLTEQFNK